MATSVEKRYFTFVKGLNTEAGPLTFPDSSWKDGDNLIPHIDGSVCKRAAIDAEAGYALSSSFGTSVAPTTETIGSFTLNEWTNVGGDGNVNFSVVQLGADVLFYNNVASAQSGSYVGKITLSNAANNTSIIGTSPISCFSCNGRLLIVSADTDPLILSYNAGSINSATVAIQIRDLYGLNDGLAVNTNPATLANDHYYNLQNQGWGSSQANAWASTYSTWPSNAQVWHAGKDSSGVFSPSTLSNIDFGTTPAAKGRFVLSLFNRDRTAVSGLGGLTAEVESYRPSTVSFWAGRAWYAGIKSSSIGQWVLYSQVTTSTDNYGKCFQSADPTAEDISDLIASDGGVIPIQEAGSIVRLLPYNNSMLVFADNGVWQVRTGIDDVFAATSYSVVKISNIGCVAPKSIVEVEQGVLYWGVSGIFVIKKNDQGQYVVDSITHNTIQTLYAAIYDSNKPFATGTFLQKDKIVYWLYSTDVRSAADHRYKYNRILCLDTRLGSWYTLTISQLTGNTPYVFDLIVTRSRRTTTIANTVVDSSSNDIYVSSDPLGVTVNTDTYSQPQIKFATLWPASNGSFDYTMSEYNVTSNAPVKWKDWYSKDGVGKSYSCYLLTGYDFGSTSTGASKDIQTVYITTFMRRTETGTDSSGIPLNGSSCLMSARWDWADSDVGGKWGNPQQIYRHKVYKLFAPSSTTYDDGYPVKTCKARVRGIGKALQLYFVGDDNKDMQLLGWQTPFLGTTGT